MLRHLYIKNYALIDELDIDFSSGFSVITGETGAGKSIILGAIGLLLGQRADSRAVKTGCQKCTIEAQFDVSSYGLESWFEENDLDVDGLDSSEGLGCTIRREVTAAGKSRGFINDTPVTVQMMKELGERLIDVHSQHQNLLLQKEDFQLNVIDIIAGNEKLRTAYTAAYDAYRKAFRELEELKQELAESQQNEDFMRYQMQELTEANLVAGEQTDLEQEQEAANHTEDIKTALFAADNSLNGEGAAIDTLRQAASSIAGILDVMPKMQEISERLDSALIELRDIASEVSTKAEDVDFDPERLQYITDRLDHIYTLERKHHVDNVEALITERERLQEIVNGIDNSDEVLREKEAELSVLRAKVSALADKLTASRQKAAPKVEKEVIKRLTSLGMPNVLFTIEMVKTESMSTGQDKVAFLFSANKGMAARPVSQVASGGEIARVMLSLKAIISTAVKLPTIIFDEIDTGVSGKIAEKMADIMRQMGDTGRQVISITHLPQIAAFGTHHYKVEKHDTKTGTTSVMRQLTQEERIDEIAQMLSGSNVTDAARINARELLKFLD